MVALEVLPQIAQGTRLAKVSHRKHHEESQATHCLCEVRHLHLKKKAKSFETHIPLIQGKFATEHKQNHQK
jgi:hypothetical protein